VTSSEPAARRFRDKVCVVTGAGGGIGSAISARLAAEEGHVIVCDVDEDAAQRTVQAIAEQGGAASALGFDLSDGQACRDAVEEVVSAHGRLDVLVNNAGINRRGDLLSLTESDWDASFAVNVHALFHLCRAVLPHMVERGGGAIVNTASQWGLHPAPGHIAYNVSKAAVVSFTQNLARDYARHHIRVNAVAPGEIRTPMLEAGLTANGRAVADLDALVPLGRIGRPDEVAALVAFLASSEAEFICGSVVEITGAQAVA
jgi:NAD(P)-dependent dehydrogenase (short-subunit alcohol dehydrogenase family)